MSGGERFEDRLEQHECLLGGQGPVLIDDIAQGATGDELHRQIDQAVGFTLVVHTDHVRVGQARCGLGLAFEARHESGVGGQVRVHHLQRDHSVQAQIQGFVDRGHPTAGEQRSHLVAVRDDRPDEAAARTRLHLRECRSARRG